MGPPPVVDAVTPGFRVGAAEVPVVGGNLASARERGLAEAMKQAVDQAIAVVAPEVRATQPKLVAQVLGKARAFVRRYRPLQEGEIAPGRYAVKIEADVDEAALRRSFERGQAAATASPAAAVVPSYFVVAGSGGDATESVVRALASAGARVERAPAGAWDPPRAVGAAARAGLAAVAFVNTASTAEGQVRGAGVDAVSCTLGLRVVAAGSGSLVADQTQTSRSFAARADDAKQDCFTRVASAAVARIVPQAGAPRGTSDLRTIVVDADINEAGAVQPLLKQLRGSGNVSAVDVRRILPGRVELWVRSRLTAAALAALLGRDDLGPVALSGAEVAGDLVRVRARLRAGAPPPPPPGEGAVLAPPARKAETP